MWWLEITNNSNVTVSVGQEYGHSSLVLLSVSGKKVIKVWAGAAVFLGLHRGRSASKFTDSGFRLSVAVGKRHQVFATQGSSQRQLYFFLGEAEKRGWWWRKRIRGQFFCYLF